MSDILLLDNLDSFTYNLVDALRSYNQVVAVYRNCTPLSRLVCAIKKMSRPVIVLSPGPGAPEAAGGMLDFIALFRGKVPILGVCLGHQALVQSYGGRVAVASETVHGKTSGIVHDQRDMFAGLPSPLTVARYHSLCCTGIPATLTINARYKKVVMGVKNGHDRICGFQFHPESILTPLGSRLLRQTLHWLRGE
ncbi:aminodeoxychorismate/anthranilate synthase component II [Buchnera aphidicola]|uniref:aminodeoxychorismate/anthranilate synthase component II n=1 Tax=Buchnera aphidicola TaxID=9 RepID=UPI00094D7EB5|nr:aminodeoxychorismate/anthranilate synthase component II [Buchnera aphidicola]